MSKTGVAVPTFQTAAVSGAAVPGETVDGLIDLENVTARLLSYCRERNWAGADPYDALNSRLLTKSGLYSRAVPRLIMTQLLKRLPWDLRPALQIPPAPNPKSHALFLQSVLALSGTGMVSDKAVPRQIAEELLRMRAPGHRFWCWGYSFPWQSRNQLIAKGEPNLVCTVFVANALLDAQPSLPGLDLLTPATSAAQYIAEELFRSDGSTAFFAYPLPTSKAAVHNANLLAAQLLLRVSRLTGNPALGGPATIAARYSMSHQRADGSWLYGTGRKQTWVDNFHTGFNLGALLELSRMTGEPEYMASARRGLTFYLDHFFTPAGAPRYFHDRTYPIDAHSAAQSILTLLDFHDHDERCAAQLQLVARWSIEHLLDPAGFFHYRRLRLLTNKISYMRWSQAWMLLGLTRLLEHRRAKLPSTRV